MIPFCYTFNEFSKKSTFGYSDTSIQRKRGCFSKEKIIESVENTDFQHNIETKKYQQYTVLVKFAVLPGTFRKY